MSTSKVSISCDRQFLTHFRQLLAGLPVAGGAHCGDDDDEGDELDSFRGAIASGAHCGDDGDDDDELDYSYGSIASGAHCGGDEDEDDEEAPLVASLAG